MTTEKFVTRHNGPRDYEIEKMLQKIGASSVEQLISETVPSNIRMENPLNLPDGISEYEYFLKIKKIASKNKLYKTYIGMGYFGTATPSVILRNILENPAWYTSYTPYQAEISQGRLEALLNFQTMVSDLTAMEIANASLLDEATAAAEAMIMMFNLRSREAVQRQANILFVDQNIYPQTLDVLLTRANPLGIELMIDNYDEFELNDKVFGAIIQYPNAIGEVCDYKIFVENAHANNVLVTVAADLLSLALLTPPGEWGADIVVGTTQRFGIPMGYGGPHAAFFATRKAYQRSLPGRIIGVSKDVNGNIALRMALQTREQHIKRERATSNICTAQALLATMAGMYGVYHGAEGLRRIAGDIHAKAGYLAHKLSEYGYEQENKNYFDTLKVTIPEHIRIKDIRKLAEKKKINFRYLDKKTVGISIDETTLELDIFKILKVFAKVNDRAIHDFEFISDKMYVDKKFIRKSDYLQLDTFKRYRSETEMMRYIKKLERKDISLTQSMISLGSCTMKLNAATEMLPMSWIEFGAIHPFVPKEQAKGYHHIFHELEKDLCEITGFDAVSLQPNSGAAGEYAGLMVIREYHISRGDSHRNVVLIPSSAHGTNPASAAMAAMKIVIVNCDAKGNIDVADLRKKAEEHQNDLSCLMVTYPSTHGVFESGIIEICDIIHQFGGQVYMDGANMNAQVGLTSPARIGADVCHLNLHKTFAIPHGGGGPGVGPIAVAEHLSTFLPTHPVINVGGEDGITAVAAAPYGSASVLVISYAYIKMMGGNGLTEATKMAILNANYIAACLKGHYDTLYTGENGRVAHEMILDCRGFKALANITEADIAKRLMDFGFHAPTLSFPVHGTLMVEPTESESVQELDRFVEALITIRNEIDEIKNGQADAIDNALRNSPHTAEMLIADNWNHKYSREKAAYPLKWVADNKFFPAIGRIDDGYGDRNLMCSCAPISEYMDNLYK